MGHYRRLLARLDLLAIICACTIVMSFSLSADTTERMLPERADKTVNGAVAITTRYGEFATSDGAALRTLITAPANASKPLHPLLFTQWVSCGSVEYSEGSGSREILRSLAQSSGLALVRVERSGTGDSQGPPCNELDYDTELRHYIEAYEAILQSPQLDTSRLFLFGYSLGATTAPLLANALQNSGYNVSGVAVQGGGALTHFERMLHFDRFYLERRPNEVPLNTIAAAMNDRAVFHAEYLIKGRHPDLVAQDSEAMARVRADIRGMQDMLHYGRPFAWHQQANRRDFLGAWAALDANVLVIFNSFDQFETRQGHALIVDSVNRLRPNSARLIEQHGLGHNHRRYDSILDAYQNLNPEPAWQETAAKLNDWFQQELASITQ